MFDFFKNVGPTELIVVAIVVFLLFGSKVLVNLSRKLGKSTKELREIKKELQTIKEGVA